MIGSRLIIFLIAVIKLSLFSTSDLQFPQSVDDLPFKRAISIDYELVHKLTTEKIKQMSLSWGLKNSDTCLSLQAGD